MNIINRKVVLVGLFFCFLLGFVQASQAAVRVYVDPPTKAIAVNETTTINIMAESVTGLGGFEFNLSFDQSAITIASPATIDSTKFYYIVSDEVDNITGTATLAAAVRNSASTLSGNVILAQLYITGKTSGQTSAITLSNLVLGDITGNEIPSTVENGSITVTVGGQDSDGDGYSVAQGDCNDNDASIHPGAVEVCNGVDDNCNVQIDEEYVPTPTTCGVGACGAEGELVCVNGAEVDTCTPGVASEIDSVCNGIDDDCNGETDEDYVPSETSCGAGACESNGPLICSSGALVDTCQAGSPLESEICDGAVDDNCNGQVDEGCSCTNGAQQSCGSDVGVCEPGVQTCEGGQWGNCVGFTHGFFDICDGLDSDCDGSTDEDFVDLGSVCSAGFGACSSSGTMV